MTAKGSLPGLSVRTAPVSDVSSVNLAELNDIRQGIQALQGRLDRLALFVPAAHLAAALDAIPLD